MNPTAELFTEKAWGAVVAAQQLAQQRRQQQMESEHLFATLLAQQGLASRVLDKAGVDVGTLSQRVEAYITGQPSLSAPPDNVYLGKGLNAVLDQANELKGSFGDSYIAIEHLLIDRQAVLQRAMARLEEGLRDLERLVERQGEVTERSLFEQPAAARSLSTRSSAWPPCRLDRETSSAAAKRSSSASAIRRRLCSIRFR